MRLSRGPLASRNFRLLLASQVISVLGSAMAQVAQPFAVLRIGGSAADVGYVTAAGTAPVIVFLLLGGVMADRLPRQRVMAAANVLEGTAQGCAAALVLAGQARVWMLMGCAAAGGVGLGFYFPAVQGMLPQTVPAAWLAGANAMTRMGRNLALIGGPALGGVLVGVAGPGWGLAADAASFGVAALLRLGMRIPAMASGTGERVAAGKRGAMVRELRDGWHEFASRRWLWAVVAEFSLLVAVLDGGTEVLGPVVAHDRLGGARSWGTVLAAQAVGAVLGGLVMLRFRPRRILAVACLGMVPMSGLLFALAVPLAVPLVAGAAFMAGGGLEVFGVNWVTAMQQEVPPGALSRVSAYDALGSWALAPAGAAVAGPLAAALGTPPVLAAGGILVIVLTGAVLCVPEVRGLRRRPPGR